MSPKPRKKPANAKSAKEPKQRIPFHFHAQAHAFSATFHRPVLYPIAAQASVSLPTIGGQAHSRVDNFRVDSLVSFTSATSHVSGSWMDNNEIVTTHATAVIEGLNILDFITADRIVARLTSEHHVGDPEGHFLALGSTFEGLKIAGHPVTVTLRHDVLVDCKNFDAMRARLAKDREPDKITVVTDEVALCSLAEDIDVKFPGLHKRGHILKIDHFGEISFAEIFAVCGTRTLTMLRLKLGSPNGGSGTVGEASTNGQPMPPTPSEN
jgi:hypothetical protein